VPEEQPQSVPPAQAAPAEEIRRSMRRLQRRQWWMWSSAVLVTLLLTLTIASFAFPGLLSQAAGFSSFYLEQSVRGLVGLVLLFNVYTIYQQTQIHRIQSQLSTQMEAMTKMEVRTEEVYKLAALDALTGLYNRRSGEQRLTSEILRADRTGRPLTILVIDLDGLKRMNDTHGHAAGDELIRVFSQSLTRAIRGSDLAVRFGGDEFLVLLPDCKLDEVRYVLTRLSGHRMDYEGMTTTIAFSAGWATHRSGESADQLLKRADDALYVNKRASKDASGATPRVG